MAVPVMRVARVGRPAAMFDYLLAGGLAAVVGLAMAGGALGALSFAAVLLGGAGAVVVGVRRHRPAAPGAWLAAAAGLALSGLAGLLWMVAPGLREAPTFVAVVGVLFLSRHALLAVGLVRLVRTAPGRREATLDGAIVTAGCTVVLWMFVGRPILGEGLGGGAVAGTVLAYLAVALVVLAAAARLVFAAGIRSSASRLLLLSVGAVLLADGAYWAVLAGGPPFDAPALSVAAWLGGALLLGAAALHPSMAGVGEPVPTAEGAPSRARVVTFVVLAVLGPVVAGVVEVGTARGVPERMVTQLVATGITTLLSVLLVLRLGVLVGLARRHSAALEHSLEVQQRLEHQLSHHVSHDSLTGLPNSAAFAERLTAATGGAFALLMLDLDGFSDVNDAFGHQVGDELLVEVARRVTAAVPAEAVVARPGGDEFAILLVGPDVRLASATAAAALSVVEQPYLLGGYELGRLELGVTTSVGLLTSREGESRTAAEALRDADLALREAKAAGKNRVVAYAGDMQQRQVRADRVRLSTGLRRALADEELSLHYQPIVDVESGGVYAVEALLRWSPGGVPVPPDVFIPIAEETGLILPIGGWVIDRACAQAGLWHSRYGIAVSVNVSALQLRTPDFADNVLDTLHVHGLPGEALIIELTESVLLSRATSEVDQVMAGLGRLRAAGVRIAVDDFGTGYSSLSYLCQLPVDILKIDRMFASYLTEPASGDARRTAFIQAILEVGRSLNLRTLAEGIETPDQADRLRLMNCSLAQGYLFAKPLPAAAMSGYLADQARRSLRALAA